MKQENDTQYSGAAVHTVRLFVDESVYLLCDVAAGWLDDAGDGKALSRFYRVLKHTSLPPVCCIKLRSVFCDVSGVILHLSHAGLCQWASQFPITPPSVQESSPCSRATSLQ